MKFVEITSLPKILFAHSYRAESYRKQFDISHSTLEITYLLEGSYEFTLGEQKIMANKGDVLCALRSKSAVVEAKQPHHHHTVAAKVDWTFSSDSQSLHLPLITPAEANTAKICRIIDDFVHNHILYKSQPALGAAKFLELLCTIDQTNRKYQKNDLLGEVLYAIRAKEYIHNNIRSNISQASVAKELGISSEYLCSVFKKSEGTTVMRYINHLKLEGIKALIDHAGLRLYEASAMYGYSDPNYVSRLYKQLFGYNITTPPKIHRDK